MKIESKINYDKFVEILFCIYICSFYTFPYQMLEIELILLIFMLPKLRKIKINAFLGWSIAYMAILLFSSLYSIRPDTSLFKSFQVLKNLIFANILISSIRTKEGIEKIFKYFIIAGIILLVRVLLIFPIDKLGKLRFQILGLFNANDLAIKWGTSLIFLIYFIFIKNRRNILNIYLIFLFYIAIIFTGSRKGFLFENIAILFTWIFKIKNKIKLFLILFFIIVLILIFYKEIINTPIIYNVLGKRIDGLINVITQKDEVDDSTLVRINLVKDGISYIIRKPLFGYGINIYSYLSPYELYSHNNYIELLTGVGIFGTIIYYFIYFYNLIFSYKILKKRKFIVIPSCILITTSLFLELGLVNYDSRYNIFVLALTFLIVDLVKKRRIKEKII